MPTLVAYCIAQDCANPAEANLCRSHADQLAAALGAVADLAEDLDVTITRQSATGDRIGGRSAETPLPYHDAASDARRDLHSVLSTWARDLWETHGTPGELIPCSDTLPDMAAWISRHPTWCAAHPAAGELLDEITDAIARAWRVVDLPPERIYCGPCPSAWHQPENRALVAERVDLYARPDRDHVTCHDCGTVHDVADLRADLLSAARDTLATAIECARALPELLGRELSANTIRTWAHAGKLTQHPADPRDPRQRPRYLVGDVIDLATTTPQRRTTRVAA